MAGLKTAPVTRLFRTPVRFTDAQIVGLLGNKNISVTLSGRGGFPPKDVFHLEDVNTTWVGSRIYGYDGCLLAFFGDTEDDPIFAALSTFAKEVRGEEKIKLLAEIKSALDERAKVIANNKKGEIWISEDAVA